MSLDNNYQDAYDVPYRLVRAWNPKGSKYARKSGGGRGGFGDFPLHRRLESTEKELNRIAALLESTKNRNAPFRVQIILADGQEKLHFYNHAADAAEAALAWADVVRKNPLIRVTLAKRRFKNGHATNEIQHEIQFDGTLPSLRPWCDRYSCYRRGSPLQLIPR